MKVTCVRLEYDGYFGLEVGRTYTVFGFGHLYGEMVYLVETDPFDVYPVFLSIEFFDDPVGFLPTGLTIQIGEERLGKEALLLPPCFAREYFYDELTDGKEEAVNEWQKAKAMFVEVESSANAEIEEIDQEFWDRFEARRQDDRPS